MRMLAVVRLELRVQRREPLTALYMVVFALLAMAFSASGPVELVRDRGAVPRDAAWSLMLASTAITAFGQVITTMVAATVVLRDRADRVADLLVTTRLTIVEYGVAKLCAALLMLALIYAAIPVGLVAGALLGGGSLHAALRGTLPPFVTVVLPTMLAIGALQFAAGVLSGRLWVIVGQGLVLIWLWTVAVDLTTQGGGAVAALLDPFGSAPLLLASRGWSDAERAVRSLPLTPSLLASRALWLLIGALAATTAIVRQPARRLRVGHTRAHAAAAVVSVRVPRGVLRADVPHWWVGLYATARYVSRWMLRDPGWRVLTLLGAVNVGVHAFHAPALASGGSGSVSVLLEHSRLFLILLATIYAGELVWREREERSAPLFDGLPVATRTLVAGRIAGVIVAQGVLVAVLTAASVSGTMARGGVLEADIARSATAQVLVPFVAWMLLSLAVHVVVQQKVVAHLLCIAGWALASVRFGAATASTRAPIAGTWWAAACLLALSVVVGYWRRNGAGGRFDRRSGVS